MGLYNFAYRLYKYSKNSIVDDHVDGFLHGFVSLLLLTFSTTILFRFYAQDIFFCLENAYDMDIWNDFIVNLCYVQDSYFVSPNQSHFPVVDREIQTNVYYFVPLFFLLQSLICCIPFWLWKSNHWKSGIYVQSWANYLNGKCNESDGVDNCAKSFLSLMKFKANKRENGTFYIINPNNSLAVCYCFYKISNVGVIGILIFMLNWFSQTSMNFFGIEMTLILFQNKKWETTGFFSRLYYCDFTRWDEVSGKPMKWTSQCILPYNAMYEKMFHILWYTLVLLFIMSIYYLTKLIKFLCVRSCKVQFIEEYLSVYGIDRNHYFFYTFVDVVFKKDALALFWIVSSNSPGINISFFLFDVWSLALKAQK